MKPTDIPLVSVIMPCYNAESFLREAVESILNQTYSNFELIAIDDGSTDNTYSILKKYADKDNRIVLVKNEQNIKLIRSLNKGIELAKGKYIARMDSDDISVSTRFEKQMNYLKDHPEIDIVSTGYFIIDEQGRHITTNIPRQFAPESCFYASFFFVPIGHPEIMGKASVFKENKYLEEDIALHTEDYELWSRLLRRKYKICNIKECLLYFRINSKSVSRQFTDIQDQNFILCAQQHYLDFFNISIPETTIKFLVNRIPSNISFSDLKTAYYKYRDLKAEFIRKETITQEEILKEINNVYYTHIIDVCIQIIKKSELLLKVNILFFILLHPKWFLNLSRLKYIKSKFLWLKMVKPIIKVVPLVKKEEKEYQQCTRCVMDTSDVDIRFNENGVCNHCTNYFNRIAKHVYHGERSDAELLELIENIKTSGKGKRYDCVIGVSGGIDSSYVAYKAKKRGLRVLLVHLDNGWNSDISVKNIKNLANILEFDYESYVLDWAEFRDIQLAFLRASVPEMETPTDIAIPGALHKVAAKHGVKYIISGGNFATEGILPKTWHYNAKDKKYFQYIHNKFGKQKLRTFPFFGWKEEACYKLFKGIKMVYLLNYIDYKKEEAMRILEEELGWKYYGGKHYESKYTGFVQSYIMPEKFDMDYRKATLSTQICTGEISREKALDTLISKPYNPIKIQSEKEYICKKLEISVSEFDEIMQQPPILYRDYPNAEKKLERLYALYRWIYNKEDYKS